MTHTTFDIIRGGRGQFLPAALMCCTVAANHWQVTMVMTIAHAKTPRHQRHRKPAKLSFKLTSAPQGAPVAVPQPLHSITAGSPCTSDAL